MTNNDVLKAADAVLALINSRPITPSREEIAAAIFAHVVAYHRDLAVRALEPLNGQIIYNRLRSVQEAADITP